MNSEAPLDLLYTSTLPALYSTFDVTYTKTIDSGVAVRGDSGIAGEGRAVGVTTFHSWGKCTMPLTNIKDEQRFLWPVYLLY